MVAVRVTSEDANDGFKPTCGSIDELSFRTSPDVWGYFSVKSGGGIHEFSDSQARAVPLGTQHPARSWGLLQGYTAPLLGRSTGDVAVREYVMGCIAARTCMGSREGDAGTGRGRCCWCMLRQAPRCQRVLRCRGCKHGT